MKHKLPIAILVVAAAAAITGAISFRTGVFQTASVGEVIKILNTPMSYETLAIRDSVDGSSVPESVAPDLAIGPNGPECTPSVKPWIRVLAPNGNETYTPGHKITAKWVSCNAGDKVHVSLIWKDSNNGSGGSQAGPVANDNNETVALPSDVGTDGSYKAGKLYKIQIVQDVNGTPNYNGAVDTSDDYFSITSKK